MSSQGWRSAKVVRKVSNAVDRIALVGAEDRPVFVGGAPRSGTTLLRTVLHAHPDLALPRETRFVLEAVNRRRAFGDLRVTANRERFVNWLVDAEDKNQFNRLGLDRKLARQRLLAAPPTMGSVLATAFAMFAEANGARRWGDKRPKYVIELPTIFSLFPDVHFISIVRDPRAVIASLRKLGWLETWHDGSVARAAHAWLRAIETAEQAQGRYRSDQILHFRYEDLVKDPKSTLKRICSFAGLSEEHLDRMLAFYESDDGIPDKKKSKFHPLVAQPFVAHDPKRWAEHLSDEEAAFIERALARPMERYGYAPAATARPPAELEEEWAMLRRINLRKTASRAVRSATYPHRVAAEVTTAQRRRARILRLRPG